MAGERLHVGERRKNDREPDDRIGADGDIAIFDPARVIDKATFDEPLQYSEGIPFVLVNGVG